MKKITKTRLDKILSDHANWRKGTGGCRANLSWANLSGADLSKANLSGADLSGADLSWANLSVANLDFGSWPLWCGSLHPKIDERLGRQLLYHALAVCAPWVTPTKKQRDWANKFHRVADGSAPRL